MCVRYEYQSLDIARKEVRLLKVLPANDGTERPGFVGEIIHASLETMEFTAISYAWEDAALSNFPSASQCVLRLPRSQQLPLGRNLAALFSILQETLLEKLFWIDAICINQLDAAERSREVARMRDIYSAASDVLVWLGPEEHESPEAMSLIGMIAHRVSTTNPNFEDFQVNPDWPKWPPEDKAWVADNVYHGNHLAQWKAFRSLLERNWWVRVWMCQEIALAKNVMFLCGLNFFSYHDLYSVMFNISGEDFDWIDALLSAQGITLNSRRVDIVFDLLLLWNSAGAYDLLQTLWLTVDRHAHDERDKVYGVLGIASDAQAIVSRVNYSITSSDLYRDVAATMVAYRGDLDYFSMVFNRTTSDFPPWIPTASRADTYLFNTAFFEPGIRSFDFSSAGGTKPQVNFHDANGFTAKGFVVDSVYGLGPALSHESDEMIQSTECNFYDSNEDAYRALWMSLVGSISEIDAGFEVAPDVFGELFAARCHQLEIQIVLHQTRALTSRWGRWYTHNREWRFAGRSIASWATLKFSGMSDPILHPSDHPRWPDFDKMWGWLIPHRRLMSTEKGLLGLVPDTTRPGDKICILYGGRVPFVLRPCQGRLFFLIGEAYLHGVMNGEFINHNQAASSVEMFDIR